MAEEILEIDDCKWAVEGDGQGQGQGVAGGAGYD